jgi:hypothetical protein
LYFEGIYEVKSKRLVNSRCCLVYGLFIAYVKGRGTKPVTFSHNGEKEPDFCYEIVFFIFSDLDRVQFKK